MKKHFIIAIYTFLLINISAQKSHLTFGIKNTGISFGNSEKVNGIRLNAYDFKPSFINGVDFSLISKSNVNGISFKTFCNSFPNVNGISLNLIGSNYGKFNGLGISSMFSGGKLVNGIVFSGLANGGNKFNGFSINGLFLNYSTYTGIGITGLWTSGKNLKGVFISGIMIHPTNNLDPTMNINGLGISLLGVLCTNLAGISAGIHNHIKNRMRGVTLGLRSYAYNFKGLQMGLIFNETKKKSRGVQIGVVNIAGKDFKGVQIGLWNQIGKRKVPLINFRF